MALYGNDLKASILRSRDLTLASIANRNERIANWQTDEDDCFMSIRADQQALDKYSLELKILEGDGTEERDVIVDENGDEVRTHWFKNRWGRYTIVGRGIFAASENALLKKTGWTKTTKRVPVWVKFCTSGTGLLGAYTGSWEVVRWHTNMVTGEYVGFPE